MIRMTLAKALSVKAAAVAIAVTALGGVAVAAGTGTLPAPGHHDHPAPVHPTVSPTAAPRQHHDPKAGRADERHAKRILAGHPSPWLPGLCRAYTAGVADSSGKALDNPAFTRLAEAAGGKARIRAFCVALLAKEREHALATPPRGGLASTHPTGRPTLHPGAEPTRPADGSVHSTAKPTAHPTPGPGGR